MDYSDDLLKEIEKLGEDMMTPPEIGALLGIDEDIIVDDIHTKGTAVRKAYLKGYMRILQQTKQSVRDAAITGSPFALQKSIDYLNQIADFIL